MFLSETRSVLFVFLVFLYSEVCFAANELEVPTLVPLTVHHTSGRIKGAQPLRVIIRNVEPDKSRAKLWRISEQVAVNDDSHVENVRYEIRFTDRSGEVRKILLSEEEGLEFIKKTKEYADPAKRYNVWRKTSGYTPGKPIRIYLYANVSDRLQTHGDYYPHAVGKPKMGIKYEMLDADRENHKEGSEKGSGNPHGRIVLDERGRVQFRKWYKEMDVYGINPQRQPMILGEVPSVEGAIKLAQEFGDSSNLRFAADFGPQRSSNGKPRGNQLMPVVPIGTVEHEGSRLVVFLPPDQLQAYNRGELGEEALLVIPREALRFVPDSDRWNEVIEDYFKLRKLTRLEQIYVANRRNGRPEGKKDMTMSVLSILGSSPEVEPSILGQLASPFLRIADAVQRPARRSSLPPEEKALALRQHPADKIDKPSQSGKPNPKKGPLGNILGLCFRPFAWLFGG